LGRIKLALIIAPLDIDVGMKESLPHIGIAYIAGNVDAQKTEVRIFDCPALRMTGERLIRELKQYRPDVVGLTAMTHQIDATAKTAESVKRVLPDSKIIIGGYHVSAVPVETIQRYPVFDIGVAGEGELTLRELTSLFADEGLDADISGIPGVCYRVNGETAFTGIRPFIEDLDSLSYPAYHLMPMERYIGFYSMLAVPRRTVAIVTGRGCPYKCIFCYKAMGEKYRTRKVASVIEELKWDISEYQIKDFVITDESFLLKKQRIYEFCETIIKENINKKVNWICQSRVDHADPELLKLMKTAGCRVISFGVETGNQQMMKDIGKAITKEQAINAVRWAREAGIFTDTNYIIGHPGETRETIKETIDFSLKLNPDAASFSLLVPFPGTVVADMAARGEGGLKQLSHDYRLFGKQVGGSMELEDIPRVELEKYQRTAYMKFFLRPGKIFNLLRIVSLKLMFKMAWHSIVSRGKPGRGDHETQ